MFIKDKLISAYKVYSSYRTKARFRNNMKNKILNADIDIRALSVEEKQEIDFFWGKYGLKPDYSSFRWYYSVNGYVDPRYIPEDIFALYIKNALNTSSFSGLNDKNLFDLLFAGERQASTIFRCCNGVFTDENYNIIAPKKAKALAKQYDFVVIKPTVDSWAGKGIICMAGIECNPIAVDYGRDYIVQEVIKQHKTFASLNESSVNVVRMTSLLFNNKVHILDSIVRVGAPGSFTDHKNIAIGVNANGTLKDYGITVNGAKVSVLPNGLSFGGLALAGYQEMVELVTRVHPRISQAGLIGWDLTADEEGHVVIIEANYEFPGIIRGQDCNGPFFGDLTDEVIKFALSKRKGGRGQNG